MGTQQLLKDLITLFEAKGKQKTKKPKRGVYPKTSRIRQKLQNPFSYRDSIGPGPRGRTNAATDYWKCTSSGEYSQTCVGKKGEEIEVPVDPAWKAAYNREYWRWGQKIRAVTDAAAQAATKPERKQRGKKAVAKAANESVDVLGYLLVERKQQQKQNWMQNLDLQQGALRKEYGLAPNEPIPAKIWRQIEQDKTALMRKSAKGALTAAERKKLRRIVLGLTFRRTKGAIQEGVDIAPEQITQVLNILRDVF